MSTHSSGLVVLIMFIALMLNHPELIQTNKAWILDVVVNMRIGCIHRQCWILSTDNVVPKQ